MQYRFTQTILHSHHDSITQLHATMKGGGPMSRMLTAERRKSIAEYIIAHGSTKAGVLAKMFHVSTETIRKDLIYLDEEGWIKKSHGGALSTLEFMERPLKDRESSGTKEKNAIAERALEYIKDNKVIFLDAGITCMALAKLLYLKKGLIIFTTSLSIANVLANSENTVCMSGGTLNPDTMALEGFGGSDFLRHINVDIAFLGTSGFKGCNGPTAIGFAAAEMKQIILSRARITIILTRHAKANTSALVEYTDWHDIDYLLTDVGMDQEEYKRISEVVKIVQVPVGS